MRKSLPRCSLGLWEREFRAKGKAFQHSSAKPNRWLTSLSGWLEVVGGLVVFHNPGNCVEVEFNKWCPIGVENV